MAFDAPGLFAVAAPPRLYRIAFAPDVAAFPSWHWQRGANRWDHPLLAALWRELALRFPLDEPHELQQRCEALMLQLPPKPLPYRVLYTAGSRMSAFIEVLQDFRPSSTALSNAVLDEIQKVDQDSRDIDIQTGSHTGVVPDSHFEQMYIGEIEVDGARPFANVTHLASVQYLRGQLLEDAQLLGYPDVDLSTILGTRAFTQLVSYAVFDDPHGFAGIYHTSVHGEPHVNWAVFETPADANTRERVRLSTVRSEKVRTDDPDLRRAVDALGLEIEGAARETRRIGEQRERPDVDER